MTHLALRLLAELDQRAQREEALYSVLTPAERRTQLWRFSLTIGREAGQLVNLLVRTLNCTRILELGTGIGYSTIWLADAARCTGGKVTSIDIDTAKQAIALNHVAEADVLGQIEFHNCDAVHFLTKDSHRWDFVLIDLWKELYIPCFDLLAAHLDLGAIVVADNVQKPSDLRATMLAYQEHVRRQKQFDSIDLAIGNGLELTLALRTRSTAVI